MHKNNNRQSAGSFDKRSDVAKRKISEAKEARESVENQARGKISSKTLYRLGNALDKSTLHHAKFGNARIDKDQLIKAVKEAVDKVKGLCASIGRDITFETFLEINSEALSNDNIFKHWYTPEVISALHGLGYAKIPFVSRNLDGLEDAVTKYNEALNLQTVLDERDSKMIDGRGTCSMRYADVDLAFGHMVKAMLLRGSLSRTFSLGDWQIASPISGLGYGLIQHHAVEEFGLSLTEDKSFPNYIVDAATELMIKRSTQMLSSGLIDDKRDGIDLSDYLNVTASFPRGKNTGFPWMASGKDRLMNNLVLSVDAALASAFVRGYPVSQAFEGLAHPYVVFSRFQASAKLVPMHIDGVLYKSFMFEPRRRLINSTSKPLAMALKPFMKWVTKHHIHSPEFSQDREDIRKRVKKTPWVKACDASRFDLRSGGRKLNQGLEVLHRFASHFHNLPESIVELLHYEANLPTLVDVGLEGTHFKLSDKESLKSGASSTSRVGSAINLMYDMYVTAKSLNMEDTGKLVDYYMTYAPSIILGDDLLKLFPTEEHQTKYMEHLDSLADLGMIVEEEKPTKFLGYLVHHPDNIHHDYEDGQISETGDRDLFHSSNPLNNMFFPERFRTNAVASMISRYIILKEKRADTVLKEVTKVMQDKNYLRLKYDDFLREVYPTLEAHYADHPSGAARQYFNSLPRDSKDADLISKNLFEDLDTILHDIGKGSAYDFDTKLVGVHIPDSALEDMDVVTSSLSLLSPGGATAKDNIKQYLMSVGRDNSNTENKVRQIINLFSNTDDRSFVHAFRAILPSISRRVGTPLGDVYIANLR